MKWLQTDCLFYFMSLQRLLYDVCDATRNLSNVSYTDHRTLFWRTLVLVGWTVAACPKEPPSFKGPVQISIVSDQPPIATTAIQESCLSCCSQLKTTQVLLILCRCRTGMPGVPFAKMTRRRKSASRADGWVRLCILPLPCHTRPTVSAWLGVYCWCHHCLETKTVTRFTSRVSRSCAWSLWLVRIVDNALYKSWWIFRPFGWQGCAKDSFCYYSYCAVARWTAAVYHRTVLARRTVLLLSCRVVVRCRTVFVGFFLKNCSHLKYCSQLKNSSVYCVCTAVECCIAVLCWRTVLLRGVHHPKSMMYIVYSPI